jgi:hypothetical protein
VAITDRRPRFAHPFALFALLGVAVLVAACGETSAPSLIAVGSPSPSAGSSDGSSAGPASEAPSASAGSDGSPAASVEPGGSPSPDASGALPPTVGPSPAPGSADACSGSAENRDFYAALASSVTWDVYCATLPTGWFVESGSYRLSNGGQLSITYRGPGGARIVVREGGYCAGVPGCMPTGTDAGSARFGDRDARLLDPGDGSWLVAAASTGGDVAWQAVGTGMDGPTLAGYTAAFARVGP